MSPAVVKLQEQLANLQSDFSSVNKALEESNAKLLAIEEAKAAAEAAKVEEASNMRNNFPKGTDVDKDLDDLTPSEVLGVVADAFDKGFDAKSSKLVKQVSEEMEDIRGQLKQFGQAMMQQSAQRGVEDARAKYKDFDKFKDDTVKVLEAYPQMNIEDAYLLARSKRAKEVPPEKESFSERPSNILTNTSTEDVSRPANRRNEPPKKGVASFRDILNAGVEKVVNERKEFWSGNE